MTHRGGTIGFGPEEVVSVNSRPGVHFVWIILEDGTQINIPLNIAEIIGDRATKPNISD